jgi:hypothetical protein
MPWRRKNMFLNDHGAKRGRFDGHHSAAPAYGSYGGGGGASTSYGGYSGGGGGRGDMPPCNTLFIGNLSDQVLSSLWSRAPHHRGGCDSTPSCSLGKSSLSLD